MSLSWLNWDSFSDDFLVSFLGLNLQFVVILNSLDESKSGLRFSNVFNSDTDSLWNDSSIVRLVDDDTNCMAGNIVNSSGFTMIVLVWHAFVDGTVDNDVHIITNSVIAKVP